INGSSSTLSHETGHFFSLAHPFYGWDCHPYNTTEYTNPVNVDYTIECDGGGGSEPIELHNRSNCSTSGDHICDTPEDYNLGLLYQNDCSQNTTVRDKNGELITPMTNNFMSYYRNCAQYLFTQTQKDLMNTDFSSFHRVYIRTGVVPNTDPVTGPVSYIYPINGEMTNGPTGITLDWADTPGANHYLVIYAKNASFTINPVKTITTASELPIAASLSVGSTYYWKVWPYNESQTGAMYSATQNFVVGTGSGVNEIGDITEYGLIPNPAATGNQTVLNLKSISSFHAIMRVVNPSGMVIEQQVINVEAGDNNFPIDTHLLPAGLYFVALTSDQGRLIERLMIMQ
ncbi:MAG TPA: zinc-dependent metalloprotease, partial [Saprospiraceae bacterium]|nr:zinc-dependent metalloprotease [Saprospiraceae bacterium]